MPVPFRTPFLVVCAAAGLACASDDSLAPTLQTKESRWLTDVSLGLSGVLVLNPGRTFSLHIVPRDQRGDPMVPDTITYSSSDPAVAMVSGSGVVTAVTGGTAIISATATIGASSRSGAIPVTVQEPDDPVLLLDENYRVLETLDLSSGLAKRTFKTPGKYADCSGICWDPPDFGFIHVN